MKMHHRFCFIMFLFFFPSMFKFLCKFDMTLTIKDTVTDGQTEKASFDFEGYCDDRHTDGDRFLNMTVKISKLETRECVDH